MKMATEAKPGGKKNGLVRLTTEQNDLLVSLTAQRRRLDEQLKLVLQTIAAGHGITEAGDMKMDLDAKTVRFLSVGAQA